MAEDPRKELTSREARRQANKQALRDFTTTVGDVASSAMPETAKAISEVGPEVQRGMREGGLPGAVAGTVRGLADVLTAAPIKDVYQGVVAPVGQTIRGIATGEYGRGGEQMGRGASGTFGEPSAAELPSYSQTAARLAAEGKADIESKPTNLVQVSRSPSGTLEFSGKNVTGDIDYTGMPNWRSSKGGAFQGGFMDMPGMQQATQAAPAQTAARGGMDDATQAALSRYNEVADRLANNPGRTFGDFFQRKRDRMALQQMSPALKGVMDMQSAQMQAEATTSAARTKAQSDAIMKAYEREVGLEKIAAESTARQAEGQRPKALNPLQQAQLDKALDERMILTGIDPRTGQVIPEDVRQKLMERAGTMKTPAVGIMYGGMPGAE